MIIEIYDDNNVNYFRYDYFNIINNLIKFIFLKIFLNFSPRCKKPIKFKALSRFKARDIQNRSSIQ